MSFARRCQQVLWGFSLMSALINVLAIPLGAQRPSATNPRKTEWQFHARLRNREPCIVCILQRASGYDLIYIRRDIQYNNWKPMTLIIPLLMIGNVMTFMTRNTCGISSADIWNRAFQCVVYIQIAMVFVGCLPLLGLFPAWLAGSPLDVHSIFEEKPEITEDVEEDATPVSDAKGAELP